MGQKGTKGNPPTTLGAAGTTSQLRLAGISTSGNSSNKLTIQDDVTLVINATAGSNAISLTSQSCVALAPGASLKLYTVSNLAIGGNGVADGGAAAINRLIPIARAVWTEATDERCILNRGSHGLHG